MPDPTEPPQDARPTEKRTRRMEERAIRHRIAHQLRAAATADPDGVDPLAAHIWAKCHRDEEAGATWDDPRRITTVAYLWLAGRLDDGQNEQRDEKGFRHTPQSEPVAHLRDRIATALYQWTLSVAAPRATRPPYLDPRTEERLRENSLARADAVLPVVEAAIADARARFLEMATRAEAQQERAEEAEEAAEQHARNTETVARECESFRQAWKDEQKKTIVARARTKQAEAAVQRVRDLAKAARQATKVPPVDCTNTCYHDACDCSGAWRPVSWDLDPAQILAALDQPEAT